MEIREKTGKIWRKIFIFPIRIYQRCISPLYPARCRFYPSCSQYTAEAIEVHGVFYGICLGTKRIFRCNPWTDGGFDPIPTEANLADLIPFSERFKKLYRRFFKAKVKN